MSVPNDSADRMNKLWSSAQRLMRSIRARIVFPYIILTILVAFAGTFIVTTLVQGSLEDRLRNQLLDAAEVANDEVAKFRNRKFTQLRELTFLQGAYEAMRDGDIAALEDLLVPSISNSAIHRTIITDLSGDVVLDILLPLGETGPQTGGSLVGRNLLDLLPVKHTLDDRESPGSVRHTGLVKFEDQFLVLVSAPFRLVVDPTMEGGSPLGVVIVAEPLHSLLQQILETAVTRRVTVYDKEGQILATTAGEDEPSREGLSITPAFFQLVASNPTDTRQENRVVLGRSVRFAYFVFQIHEEALGVMSIGIGSGFVTEKGVWGRIQLSAVFTAAMLAVIAIGYGISQRITQPIMRLVRTSRAVAQGDLSQRTGIQSDDEIGTLAETFDDMTEKLALRTAELERLLQEKREEASRVQAILSSIAEGILMEDQDSQFGIMNPAAHDLLEILSSQFQALKPLKEMDRIATGARRFEIGERVISVETSPVMMPDGKQLGKVLVLRDITRETEVDRLKDEFIAQISHELRTPLTSIKGYSDLLLRTSGEQVGGQLRPFLERINRHSDSLEDMISELLDFTQLEAGNLGLRFGPMSMGSVVQRVVEEWAERFADKDIEFTVQIDGPIPQIMGDEGRLRRALVNLVKNACNYTLEEGKVTLSLGADDHSITVAINDSGVGIAPEDQVRLFTRFFRVSLERTIDVRGSGLGLLFTKAVVEGHGGTIWVESVLGEGSTFTFTLPLDAGMRDRNLSEDGFTDLGDLLQ